MDINYQALETLVIIKTLWNILLDFSWANNIEKLKDVDSKRNQLLWDEVENAGDINSIREFVYRFVNHPLQGICKGKPVLYFMKALINDHFHHFQVGKYFGGIWISGYGCLDGHKYVCLDNLYEDVMKNECLIYSFGINNEWSFEESMVSMGCKIRSFDPTIDGTSKPNTDLITFQKIGMGDQIREEGIGEVALIW